MKKKNSILLYLTSLLIIISCEKKHEFDYPLVFTGDVINITDTSAVLTAKVSNYGEYPIIESGFIWGVHSNDNYGIKITNEGSIDNIFSLSTNVKLLPGKTYYVRGYVQTESATSYGREVNFKSPNGQIDTGIWAQIYRDNLDNGWCKSISSSFTINGTTFFVFYDEGTLYSYNHATNTFNYVLTNPILSETFFSVVYNDNAYVFSNNAFYLYNSQNKTFNKLAVLNVSKLRFNISGFLINDNIYIGAGSAHENGYSKDFWKYNITKDTWQQVASFPGEYRISCFSFSFSKTGYVGGGFNFIDGQWPYPKFNDLWCYIPEIDKWIQKEQFPIENKELPDLVGTNTGNFGYCLYKNIFFEYNPTFDIWQKMADLDIDHELCYPHIFASNNRVFILDVKNNNMNNKYFKMWVYEK